MAFTVYAAAGSWPLWREQSEHERPWIGISHDLKNAPAGAWMERIEARGQVVARGNSFVTTHDLAANGLGLAVLPCFLADCDPRLVRVEPPIAEIATSLWVLTHKDLKNSARVRALSDHLSRCLRGQRALLEGRSAGSSKRRPRGPDDELPEATARMPPDGRCRMARVTGLEPAASGVTGRRSNQLSYTRRRGSALSEGRAARLSELRHPHDEGQAGSAGRTQQICRHPHRIHSRNQFASDRSPSLPPRVT